MAKVKNNLFVRGLSDSQGTQLMVRQTRSGRAIVSASPTFDENRIISEAQLQKFQAMSMHGRDSRTDMLAMADFVHAPEISELDIEDWSGAPGQIIRIKAVEHVRVERVNVIITHSTGTALEQGPARRAEGNWWTYTTTSTAPDLARVVVTARDLPWDIAEFHVES